MGKWKGSGVLYYSSIGCIAGDGVQGGHQWQLNFGLVHVLREPEY